jgi:hypothetical protein
VAGFWKAPRALAHLLARRRLTPTGYALVNFVGQLGGDRPDGIVTTTGFLAGSLGVSERTVRRALHALRREGFLAFDDHRGSATFQVRTTPALQALASADVAATSDTRSDTGWDTGSDIGRTRVGHAPPDPTSDTPSPVGDRNPASAEGKPGAATSDTSRAHMPAPARERAETETETEIRTTADAVVRASRDFSNVDLDEILLAHVRAHSADAQGIVAALVETLTELAGEPLFARTEFAIVGRHAKELLAQGQPPARVASAGLVALLRRQPGLTQRLCGDLAARGAGALVTRDEWQAYLANGAGAGPLQAMHERRAALGQVVPARPAQPPCPQCGTGGGRHAADCPQAGGGS